MRALRSGSPSVEPPGDAASGGCSCRPRLQTSASSVEPCGLGRSPAYRPLRRSSVLVAALPATALLALGGTPPARAALQLVFEDDFAVNGATPVGGEASKVVTGGAFVAEGWQVTADTDQIAITLAQPFAPDKPGAVEVDVTSLDPMVQWAQVGKTQFFCLYSSPISSQAEGSVAGTCWWVLRAGNSYLGSQAGFKFFWTVNDGWPGSEQRIWAGSSWDPADTHTFRCEWTATQVTLRLNGSVIAGPKGFAGRTQDLAYLFLARDNLFPAITGPIYRTVRVYGEGPPRGEFRFTASSYTVDENGASATITVERVNGDVGPVSVGYAATGGTAVPGPGGDYELTPGTLDWADGDSAPKDFTVTINDDGVDDADVTVTLALSGPTGGATLGSPATATLTILDDDEAGDLRFAAGSYTFSEADGTVTIMVERVGGSAGEVAVDFAASDVTAVDPDDYELTAGTLSWADGVTAPQPVTITIADEPVALSVEEPLERFTVTLSSPTNGAALGSPFVATVWIEDDDAPGVVSLASAQYSVVEGSGGGTQVTIYLTRTGGYRGEAAVDVVTVDGTASSVSDEDYTALPAAPPTTVVWPDGDDADRTVTIDITPDGVLELNETFLVTLANPQIEGSPAPALLVWPSSATVTILDDETDVTPPTVTVDSPLDGETVGGSVVVSGTAWDDLAVASVEVSVDGGAFVQILGFADTGAGPVPWSYEWPSWAVGNGDHTISVVVTEYADDNPPAFETRNVIVDNEIGLLGMNGVGGCGGAPDGVLPGAFASSAALLVSLALVVRARRRAQRRRSRRASSRHGLGAN